MEALNTSFTLTDLQNVVLDFSAEKGISRQEIIDDFEHWKSSYKRDFSQEVETTFARLLSAMRLFRNARAQEDFVTAQCGLVRAVVSAGNLSTFFGSLEQDLNYLLKNFKEAEIPENYKIPDQYQFEGW